MKQCFDLNAKHRIQVLNRHKFSTLILSHDGVVAKSPIYFFCPKTNNSWAELFSTFYFFGLPIFFMMFCIFKVFYLQIVFCLRQMLNSSEKMHKYYIISNMEDICIFWTENQCIARGQKTNYTCIRCKQTAFFKSNQTGPKKLNYYS